MRVWCMKKIIVVVVSLLGICLIGCSNAEKDKSVSKSAMEGITKDSLSVDEEKFLEENSYYDDSQKELLDSQKAWIYRYRYAMKTLETRYPSYDFEIVSGGDWSSPADDNFSFKLKGETKDNWDTDYFTLYMEKDIKSSDDYIVEENFYGYALRDLYESYMKDMFYGYGVIGVYCSMSTVSSELSEDSTVDDILNAGINPSTKLLVDIGECDYLEDIVKSYIVDDYRVSDNFCIVPIDDPSLFDGLSSQEMYNKARSLKYLDNEISVNSNKYRKEVMG